MARSVSWSGWNPSNPGLVPRIPEVNRTIVLMGEVVRGPVVEPATSLRRHKTKILATVQVPFSDVTRPIPRPLQLG